MKHDDLSSPVCTSAAGSARVLRVRPTVDAAAAAELRRESRALLARSSDPVVVDLRGVRTVDAAAAGVLRELAYEAGDADVDLRVVRAPRARAVTRSLLADEALYEIHPTLAAALRRGADGGCPVCASPSRSA